MALIDTLVANQKAGNHDAARDEIASGRGKRLMDTVRKAADEMQDVERALLAERVEEARQSRRSAVATNLLTTFVALLMIAGVHYLILRSFRTRARSAVILAAERERLRVTLASIGDGVVTTDAAGRVSFLNGVAEKLTGWSAVQAIGLPVQRIFRIVNEHTREVVQNPIEKVLQQGMTAGLANHTILIAQDGTEWPIDDSAAPIRDGEGRILGVVLVFREISERKRSEDALERAMRAADQASRAKSDFLATMSHEIRTPMAAILGYADLLLAQLNPEKPDNRAPRDCVATIKRNGHFLLEIINDILDISRIEAGKFEVELRRFHLPQIVADVRKLMDVRAREKGIPLHVEYDGPVPETIESDPNRLRQILVNLIGNAIKFTEEGSVRVRVRLDRSTHRPALRFDVVDTGIGMTAEQVALLFQPFSQVDTAINRKYGGTGLGLTISKRLATMLQGDITVESDPGRGSRFSLTISAGPLDGVPLITPDAATPFLTADDHRPAHSDAAIRGRFLIVDDRHDVRFLAQHFVEQAGGEVHTVDNGQLAIEMIGRFHGDSRPFDVVLMDMQMPVLDGFETTRRLRGMGVNVPIIALTAGAMSGDREKCLEAGCSDYVSKPIDKGALLHAIARQLQRPPV